MTETTPSQALPQARSKRDLLTETFFVWFFVIVTIHLLAAFQGAGSILSQILGSLTAVVLVYPPVLVGMRRREPIAYWQLNAEILKTSLKCFFLASLAVFPVAFVANHFYQQLAFGLAYQPQTTDLWGSYVLSQILIISFPEEFFFRGYMQGRLASVWPTQTKVFGAPFGRAQILTSLIFAVSHSLITVQWWHIFIFFPALIFAWLKERTGTIWAGTLFHAACNVFSFWVALHYS